MDLFFQLVLNGIILGGEYALLGIGWGIIFNTTGTFHFAHGVVYTAGAYGAVLFADTLGLPLPLAVAGGVAVAVVLGVGIDVVCYAPMRRIGATPMTILITSLGVLIVVENSLPILFGTASRTIPGIDTVTIAVGPAVITNLHIVKTAAAFGLFAALIAFLRYTRAGKAMRAVGSNPEMAQIVGFHLRRVYMLAFAVGSALAGVGGILEAADTGAVPHMGTQAVLIASMAVLLGGMGSTLGSALGGFFIGMTMSLSILALPSEWQLTLAFGLLIGVIALRPRGFRGGKVAKAEI
jgi:branched-chain amino acid transport system permease protein